MNPHFFTAPFYFAFIWFKVQGSGFRVQGSGGGFAAFLEDGILASSAFPSKGRCPAGADRALAV